MQRGAFIECLVDSGMYDFVSAFPVIIIIDVNYVSGKLCFKKCLRV